MDIKYCPVCTYPFEYCCYGKLFDKCKKTKEYSEYEKGKCNAVEKQEEKSTMVCDKKSLFIVLKSTKRLHKKNGVSILGMEMFGFDLKNVSKIFSNKFACGCSVIKDETKKEIIFIQADVIDNTRNFLVKEFKIPIEKIKEIKNKTNMKQKQ